MKKFDLLTFLISLLSPLIASTQTGAFPTESDCCAGIELFDNSGYFVNGSSDGGSITDPISGCSCLTQGEVNSIWFRFECTASSTLELVIRPINGTADFDLALFEDGCPCGFPAVACNSVTSPGPPFLVSGLGKPANFGILPSASNFGPGYDMTQGKNYYLVVNNITGNNEGFEIEFMPHSKIGRPKLKSGPSLTGPTVLCPDLTGFYTASSSSVSSSLFYRYEVNPSPSIGPWHKSAGIPFDYTFYDTGTYEVCAAEMDELGCIISDTSCLTVRVENIVGQDRDTFCFPGPYNAPNGEFLFGPGVHELIYESHLGCDSTVTLTLDAAYSDFESRTDFACDGDCVMFEGEMVCTEGVHDRIYTNQYGCDSTISLNLITVPLEIKVEGIDTLTCNTTDLILDARKSLIGGPSTYLWKNEDGDTLTTDTVLNVNAPGIYTLQVTTTVAGDTCTEEETIEIIADTAPPDSVLAIGGTVSCIVKTIILQGSSSTDSVTYAWSGPNNFSSTEQNPTATLPGNYVLTVTGENGCVSIATAEVVEIEETLPASATGGAVNCNSPTVTLNGSSPALGVSYAWQGPNNTTYSGPSPTVSLLGTYLLTVTDFNGCTGTAQAFVIEDFVQPTANAGTDQILHCNSPSVLLNGNGSSFGPQFSYEWATGNGNITMGENTLNPLVDAPGLYILTVTNNDNGCTQTAQTQVTVSPPVTADISDQSNVLCFGESSGAATATGGGGDNNFTYNWSNGMMGNTINNVSEGSYIVTVSDGNNCTATSSVTITQPTALLANTVVSAQTMPGVNDGIAAASPSGGTPDYTLMWSNGSSSPIIAGLAPGNYTVTVTDANGCQTIATVTVNGVECFLEATTEQIDESCHGLEDGSATVNLANATDPVTYVWSNGETTQTVSNLAPGTYSVTSTDAGDCEVVTSVTILGPPALNVNATATGQSAFNLDDGTATANPTGGTSPYSYSWSNGDTTAMINGLPPGEYGVTITDSNDCEAVQTVAVEEFNCGVLLEIDFTDASCNGFSNGQASVFPSGGLAPFSFDWSNGEMTATIGNLPPGTYDVTVTDASDCPAQAQVIISEPDVLLLELTDLTSAACGSDNGSATVMASGGTTDYGYLWPNGETTPTVENLAEGTYTVSVTDANDCLTTLDVMIETDSTMDIEPPVAIAKDFSVELDLGGKASITAMDIDDGSFDNCGITAMTLDVTDFDCSHLGENMVTLAVTDVGGNEATAPATVTVVDNMPPVVDCPGNTTLPYCDPVFNFDIVATDNCQGNLTIDQTSGLPSGSAFPIGETTPQSFDVTDAGGNIATCNFEITVAEAMSIDPDIADISCFGEEDGSIGATVVGGSPDYTYQWSNDSTTMSIDNLGPGMYSVTVIDDAGCEAIEEYEINEPDDLLTTLVNIINETNNMSDGSVEVTVSGGVMPYTYEWTDLDGNVVGTMEDIDSLPAGTYQLFVTDSNDCVSSSSYTIQNSTSTNNMDLDAFIRIFPNPTTGSLTVEFIDLPISEIDVTVHDIVGRIAFDQSNARVNGNKYLLDLGEYPEGVYLVKLTIEGQVVTKRIVRVD